MPTEVIRKKFTPDMRFLIIRYSEQIRQEIRESEKIKDQMNNLN